MRIGDLASAIGKGLVAGAVGTLAITASQMLAQNCSSSSTDQRHSCS